jgi:hypothetical protein
MNVDEPNVCKKTAGCKCKNCADSKKKCACGSCGKKASSKIAMALLKCDIGFGNTLFIRGDQAPLNWDKGVALTYCKKRQCWIFKTELKQPMAFKVLINDERWSEGENFVLNPKATTTFEPKFS